ncbi:hypothetical protein [Streptomyces sp. NPDC053427]|uniref:hypothetical protein n=1 Tax=Streptomyces sp. NPDC053427 TaxID=3365701 RepID=UPI0037D69D28
MPHAPRGVPRFSRRARATPERRTAVAVAVAVAAAATDGPDDRPRPARSARPPRTAAGRAARHGGGFLPVAVR